jgi:glycosyltransferase involved in cell wall biosynthesis
MHLIVSILHGAIDPASPWWLQAAALPVAWLGRMASLGASAAEIAVSDHDLDHLQRWYWPYRNRLHRIYHSRLPEEPPPPVASRSPIILHVGHRAHRKGQHFLVQAFASIAHRHPEWRLVLVGPPGDDAFEQELAAIIEQHGLQDRVEIVGSHEDVSDLMRDAAVYVQPSLQEALGLALQEALFFGCACIGSTVGGIPELIAHELNGLLVLPGDAASLAAALDRLLGDQTLRDKFAGAGPAGIRQRGMSSAQMVQRHRALYARVLGN